MHWALNRATVPVMILVLALAMRCFAMHQTRKDLELIKVNPPHFSLDGLILGKSRRKDFAGNNYYYFVFQKSHDRYVSDSMQNNGGEWEGFLNSLLEDLFKKETKKNATSPHSLVVMDVGANLGSFTLFAASLGCEVRAFEMQPLVYTVLEMSIRLSGYQKHAILYNEAIWNFSRPVTFTPRKNNFGNTWIDSRLDEGKGEIKMVAKRLDSVILNENIFFIKLDVEGVEEWALRGFDSHINTKKVKHVAIGDSGIAHAAIYNWLYNVGYSCRNFGPRSSSNLALDGCENHAAVPSQCYWNSSLELEAVLAKITNGHLNILCSLQ